MAPYFDPARDAIQGTCNFCAKFRWLAPCYGCHNTYYCSKACRLGDQLGHLPKCKATKPVVDHARFPSIKKHQSPPKKPASQPSLPRQGPWPQRPGVPGPVSSPRKGKLCRIAYQVVSLLERHVASPAVWGTPLPQSSNSQGAQQKEPSSTTKETSTCGGGASPSPT